MIRCLFYKRNFETKQGLIKFWWIRYPISLPCVLEALFSSTKNKKTFQNFSLHQILRNMHEILNIDEKKN